MTPAAPTSLPTIASGAGGTGLCKFPYPYRSMLAISNDIDKTTISTFRETHRFLNTREETSMGPGLGLDVANSMWLYRKRLPGAPDGLHDQISYFVGTDWTRRSRIADELIAYAHAGWIDTLHSYGDFSQPPTDDHPGCTRAHAERALDVLRGEGVRLPVWVNHGNANNTQNLGLYESARGDDAASHSFHVDLLLDYGCVFVGTDHITAFGEEHPLTPLDLRDGRRMWGFRRFAKVVTRRDGEEVGLTCGVPFFRRGDDDVVWVWLPAALHLQLTDEALDAAAEQGSFVVVAQHLGSSRPLSRFGRPAVEAFRRVARAQDRGDVLVARLSRLLEYARVSRHLEWSAGTDAAGPAIDIHAVDDPVLGRSVPSLEQLRGITFQTGHPERTRISVDGVPVDEEEIVRVDSAGVVGIAWHEPDTRDHTAGFRDRPDVLELKSRRMVLVSRRLGGPRSAAVREGLEDTMAQLAAIGYGGIETARFLAVGSRAGLLPAALALLNGSSARVTCIEPDDAQRAAAVALAERLKVAPRVAVLPGLPEETAGDWGFFDAAFVTDLGQRYDAERLLVEVATLLAGRPLYMVNPGLGSHLRRLAESLDGDDGATAEAHAAALFANELFLCGLGEPDLRLRVVPRMTLLRLARACGWRVIDWPGNVRGPERVGALDGTFDLLLERLTRSTKKFPSGAEGLVDASAEPAWAQSVVRLVELGCWRMARREIAARPDVSEAVAAALRALTAAKAGEIPDPDLLAGIDDGPLGTRAHAIALHRLGRLDAAESLYGRVEPADASVTFLRGAVRVAQGRLEDADAVFGGLAEVDPGASVVGRLTALLAMGRRDEAEGLLRHVVGSEPLSDGSSEMPAPDREGRT